MAMLVLLVGAVERTQVVVADQDLGQVAVVVVDSSAVVSVADSSVDPVVPSVLDSASADPSAAKLRCVASRFKQ